MAVCARATGTPAWHGCMSNCRICQQGKALGAADDYFDPDLHSAVLAFQSAEGLLADGIVGPLTWIRLSDRLNLPQPKLRQ